MAAKGTECGHAAKKAYVDDSSSTSRSDIMILCVLANMAFLEFK